ncbi:MAG: hypothetical protein KA184_08050 [Candidatus Hydrogenedentes bacterium]|nr:hypothetical protein [Candidatus Hydrogenedentota bacterium]
MPWRKQEGKPPIDSATIDYALAKAVADGDIVNLRQLFAPASPLRTWSPENIYTPKYKYLLPSPEQEDTPLFREALEVAQDPNIAEHARAQLEKDGPPQLHAALVLALADNAVRLGKHSSAAQAYELLRIRPRMQEEFLRQGDAAFDNDDVQRAAAAYFIGTGLAYNYAAFPEPLPVVPDYQTKALILHADYPSNPENCIALQAPDVFVGSALTYLLLDAEAAARLDARPFEQRVAFLVSYVRLRDPEWDVFAARYREACALTEEFGRRLQRETAPVEDSGASGLAQEIEQQYAERDPCDIEARMLGRTIADGEWWQYLKELACRHPAAALFVARQTAGNDVEIIVPRMREDCPLAAPLGIQPRG